jgi:hypothetical protein
MYCSSLNVAVQGPVVGPLLMYVCNVCMYVCMYVFIYYDQKSVKKEERFITTYIMRTHNYALVQI